MSEDRKPVVTREGNVLKINHEIFKGEVEIKDMSIKDIHNVNMMRAELTHPNATLSDRLMVEGLLIVEHYLEKPESFPDPIPAKGGSAFIDAIYAEVSDFLA